MLTKQMTQFIAAANKAFPKLFMRDGAEFDGSTSPKIWTSGETGVFEYNYDCDDHYVDPAMQVLLDKYNLYFEWYDPGTVMIYQG